MGLKAPEEEAQVSRINVDNKIVRRIFFIFIQSLSFLSDDLSRLFYFFVLWTYIEAAAAVCCNFYVLSYVIDNFFFLKWII